MANDHISSNTIVHVGMIVKDIEKTSAAYATLFGVPTPDIMTTDAVDKAHTLYRGQSSTARAKLAFFKMGSIQLELIQPLGRPSTWQDFLDKKGEGVHHLAFHVAKTEDDIKILAGVGANVVQKGDYTGGNYTYAESEPQLGIILEFLQNA